MRRGWKREVVVVVAVIVILCTEGLVQPTAQRANRYRIRQ